MSITYTPEGVLKQNAIAYLKRLIGQALTEGASAEQVDAYVQGMGVKDFEKYRLQVMQKPMLPLLTGAELQKMGGRNEFRKLFSLDPVELEATPPFDYPLTESGDAEHFAVIHKDHLRYDHLRGRWLISHEESGLWLPDEVSHVETLALRTIRKRQSNALAYKDHIQRKQMSDWAMHGESRSRLTNLLVLAEKKSEVSSSGKEWDTDNFLLGTHNGRVDLRTGEHRRADPDERITMRVSVRFDPLAECPLWMRTLRQIFAGHGTPITTTLTSVSEPDAETELIVAFIQRAMGYSITGDCREECCFFCWGEGGNGKGTIINAIGEIMADYLDDMPSGTLEKSIYKSQSIPNDVAKMVGKRMITAAEVNEFTLNEARLKALTGRDPMTARFLNQEFFTFRPVGKIWISTNNKPRITGMDDGIWRRIHLIPFTNKFEGVNRNLKLKDALREEYPGILNWLIAGTRAWLEEGLNPPATVRVATEDFRTESEPITPFVEACCVVKDTAQTKAGEMFEAYKRWASDQQVEQVLTDKMFHKTMKRRFVSESIRDRAYYKGVGLVERSNKAEDPGY